MERAAIRLWGVPSSASFGETISTHAWTVRNRDKWPLVTRWRTFDAFSRRTRSCLCFRCASAFLRRSRLLFPRLLLPERLTSLFVLYGMGKKNTKRIRNGTRQGLGKSTRNTELSRPVKSDTIQKKSRNHVPTHRRLDRKLPSNIGTEQVNLQSKV